MDLWKWGACKVPNFCAPLSQTPARGANISFFFLGQFFLTRENQGDCSYSRFNQAWLNKNQIKKAEELNFK